MRTVGTVVSNQLHQTMQASANALTHCEARRLDSETTCVKPNRVSLSLVTVYRIETLQERRPFGLLPSGKSSAQVPSAATHALAANVSGLANERRDWSLPRDASVSRGDCHSS